MVTTVATLAPARHQVADIASIEAARLHRLDRDDVRVGRCGSDGGWVFGSHPCGTCEISRRARTNENGVASW